MWCEGRRVGKKLLTADGNSRREVSVPAEEGRDFHRAV